MKLQQGIFLHAARKLDIKANTKSYFQPELTGLPESWEEGDSGQLEEVAGRQALSSRRKPSQKRSLHLPCLQVKHEGSMLGLFLVMMGMRRLKGQQKGVLLKISNIKGQVPGDPQTVSCYPFPTYKCQIQSGVSESLDDSGSSLETEASQECTCKQVSYSQSGNHLVIQRPLSHFKTTVITLTKKKKSKNQ